MIPNHGISIKVLLRSVQFRFLARNRSEAGVLGFNLEARVPLRRILGKLVGNLKLNITRFGTPRVIISRPARTLNIAGFTPSCLVRCKVTAGCTLRKI